MSRDTRTTRSAFRSDRRGAAAVEFAVVAPIFFLALFGCLIFAKSMMMVSFVEESAFRAARTIIVPGAKLAEAVDTADHELGMIGVDDYQVTVEAFSNGIIQPEINHDTEEVTVNISANFNHGLVGMLRPIVVNRRATLITERLSQ